jgi:hypothetical protein
MTENNVNDANTLLREADNKVIIEGIVSEINIEIKQVQGKEAITGDIVIQTGENSIHTVDVFAYKLKKDGNDNSVFKGLTTIMDDYKSIAKYGKEEADKVRITGGKLVINDYYNPAGELKTIVKINTNFVNRLKAGEEFNPKAEFEAEVFIHKINDEVDKKTGDLTGRKIISGLVPIYDGKVAPMNFIVADKELVIAVDSMYEVGQTIKIYGDLINTVFTTTKVTAVAIGKPKEITTTITTREMIFTGGSEPYIEDSPLVFNIETIKNAMIVRAEYLEELKNKKSNNNSSVKGTASTPKSGKTLPF